MFDRLTVVGTINSNDFTGTQGDFFTKHYHKSARLNFRSNALRKEEGRLVVVVVVVNVTLYVGLHRVGPKKEFRMLQVCRYVSGDEPLDDDVVVSDSVQICRNVTANLTDVVSS